MPWESEAGGLLKIEASLGFIAHTSSARATEKIHVSENQKEGATEEGKEGRMEGQRDRGTEGQRDRVE